MKHFILTLFILLASLTLAGQHCAAQHKAIPLSEVSAKTLALQTGSLQDSIFWSVIGFFLTNEYSFTKVTDYKILVNPVGNYFKFDLADDLDSIVAGFVYFIPHNRITMEDVKRGDAEIFLNEHLCICSAKSGQATIKISATGFSCVGLEERWNQFDNLNIDCHDTEHYSVFFSKYYSTGRSLKGTLQTVPPEFIK